MPCGWVNVQPSAALGGRCSRRLCTRFLRHVAGERHKARPEVLGGVLQKVRVDIASHDARALFQEPLRDGKTDARCRARDQRALFRKTSAHYPVSSMNVSAPAAQRPNFCTLSFDYAGVLPRTR